MLEKLKKIFTSDLLPAYEKDMPEQPDSLYNKEHQLDTWDTNNLYNAYEIFEVVNRGVNLIADCAAAIMIDVGEKYKGYAPVHAARVNQARLGNMLNIAPNPDQDRIEFFTAILIDILLSGNAYIYFDGASMYRLPVIYMKVASGVRQLVNHYIYTPNGVDIIFQPEEIIRIRSGSATNPYIGTSPLSSAIQSLGIIDKMNSYQTNYFKNSTVLGVVLLSKNILGDRTKARLKKTLSSYSPTSGANNPIILDGDVQLQNLSKQTNKDLDYDTSLKAREHRVLQALGVPPILLDTGNNTNIDQNLKLFYLTTVIPLMGRVVSALERYFGFDLKLATADVPALLPDARVRSQSLQSLVNSGILTRNEAREDLRRPKATEDFADALIIPANIAGSNLDPNQGGRPNANDK